MTKYTVDVHRIFRIFDADPTNPASYDFECTDQCAADSFSVGYEVYYRPGSRIEHGKKLGTFPPKDLKKCAEAFSTKTSISKALTLKFDCYLYTQYLYQKIKQKIIARCFFGASR